VLGGKVRAAGAEAAGGCQRALPLLLLTNEVGGADKEVDALANEFGY
jgi:hypothetical protein